MTFHARLSELIEKAKTSRLSFNDLQDLLTDHAEAIRDLVVAAEEVIEWSTVSNNEDDFLVRLGSALAKLEES